MGIPRWNSYLYQTQWQFSHSFPRQKRLKWFLYDSMAILLSMLDPKHSRSERTFPLQKSYLHILVYCVLRDSSQFTHPVFFFLCFSLFFWMLFSRLQIVCSFLADCCQAKDQYIEQFKDTLSTAVAKSIAGFFVEPIQVGILTLDTNWAQF